MAQDEFGNYETGLKDNVDFVTPQSGSQVQVGAGAPTSSTPVSPFYIDSVSEIIDSNPTLTAGAWVASGNASSGAGSPTSTTPGVFYFKTSDSTIWANNNGTWEQIV